MTDYNEVIRQIEELGEKDFENLKARICTDKECKITREAENLSPILTKAMKESLGKGMVADLKKEGRITVGIEKEARTEADIEGKLKLEEKSKLENQEVKKMSNEQNIDNKILNLSEKYKNRIDSGVSKYNTNTLKSTLSQVSKVDDKIAELYDKIIKNEVPLKDRFAYKVKEFMAKLHLGQMPDKIEIKEVFESKFEKLDDIAQTLYQQTTEAFSKSESLKAHLALLYDERENSQKKYSEAYEDAVSLDAEIIKLEDKGVSLLPYQNKGTDSEAKELMEIQDLYDNAIYVFRNEEMNYQIRENAIILCKFYRDVVKEIANTGKQAHSDIQLMIREMRNAIHNAMTCSEMMESIKKSDQMVGILSNYVGDMTKTSLGYLGIVKDVRINNGEIIPGDVNDSIKNKYKELGTTRETRAKELKEISQRMFQGQK